MKYTLKTLTILAFAVLVLPATASAASYGYGTNTPFYTGYYDGNYYNQPNNPTPSINFVSPSYAEVGSGGKTITITGRGFVPTSIARVNGADRATTFIDSSHLFIQLTNNDMYLGNGFYITVWNGAPGGGFSDSAFFTLNQAAAYNNNTNNYSNTNNGNNYNNGYPVNNNNYNYGNTNPMNGNGNVDSPSNLAANAVFGTSNSFLPSGIVQWVLFAIVVLLIVILVRRIFGARDNYYEAPMKHD